MDENQLPEILKKILSLEGTWEADAKMEMGGKTYDFKYKMVFKKVSDGNGLIMEESADIPELANLRGTNVIGFDPYGNKLHWFTVDNLGTTHDHTADSLDGNKMTLLHESEKEGKKFRETIKVIFESDNSFHAKLVGVLDGETEESLEGMFIRKTSDN